MNPDAHDLVDILTVCPRILVSLRYATAHNFAGEVLYPANRAFLRRGAAAALGGAQEDLEHRGFGLMVWDAYRPLSIQRRLWERKPDPRFVAPPERGSRHNRGAAVDLTLVNREGRELEMPTDFDDFSERASADYSGLRPDILKRRTLLQEAMTRRGFLVLDREWWHFDARNWRDYSLADTAFDAL